MNLNLGNVGNLAFIEALVNTCEELHSGHSCRGHHRWLIHVFRMCLRGFLQNDALHHDECVEDFKRKAR